MESIWKKQTTLEEHNKTIKFEIYDAVIIGGGLTGLLTAYYLQKMGKAVVVVERESIGQGATGDSVAMITGQHGMIYDNMINKQGSKNAKLYAKVNQLAINEYERIIKENNIECHFERCPSYIYSTENMEALKREAEASVTLGLDARFTTDTELPFDVAGAVRLENQAKFNPLEFIEAISKELVIYENVRIRVVGNNTIDTNRGILAAKNIIFATQKRYPNFKHRFLFGIKPEQRSVMALSGCAPMNGMYYGVDEGGLALRSAGDYLLLGEAEKKSGRKRKAEPDACEYLRACANEYFPDARETACWTSTDYYTKGRLPYIGTFSGDYSSWMLALGFGNWGMTRAMAAAMINSDIILQKGNPYEKLFSREKIYSD